MLSRAIPRVAMLSTHIKASFSAEEPVLFEKGKNGVKVTLNKPSALNALDLPMINLISKQIPQWNTDPNVKVVLLRGAGEKAFCAGGDIKSLYDAKKSGDLESLRYLEYFFRHEFTVDYQLSQLNATQVALWDGIVMGGGVGISINSKVRVATEATTFAMPEAKIGFFTDVGGSYFLSRLRNNLGFYIALTGQRLKGPELVQVGLADYFIKKENVQKVQEELLNEAKINDIDDVRKVIDKYNVYVEKKYPTEETIERLFDKNTLQEVIQELKSNHSSELHASILKTLNEQCPTSLRVIFEQIKRGKDLSLAECFKMDFRLTQRFVQHDDFFEGIRCMLIDRKDKPKWKYNNPEEIPDSEIESYFKGLPTDKELHI